MKRRLFFCIFLLVLCVAMLAGCKNQEKNADLQAASLEGSWELFEPLGAWAKKMTLLPSGKATLNGISGEWTLLEEDRLRLTMQDGQVIDFSIAVEEYFLLLQNPLIDFSIWYINPQQFANGEFEQRFVGNWLSEDYAYTLQITAEGEFIRTHLPSGEVTKQNFFARGNIARLYAEDTGAVYYSYDIGNDVEGKMTLSEYSLASGTTQSYYPQEDSAAYSGEWYCVASDGPSVMPASIHLREDGTGEISGSDLAGDITWAVYQDTILLIHNKQGELLDLYFDMVGGSLYVDNETDAKALYVCDAQMNDPNDNLPSLQGKWTTPDGAITASFQSQDNHMQLIVNEGEKRTVYDGDLLLGSSMIKLTTPESTQYFVYELSAGEDTLYLGDANVGISGDGVYWTMMRDS